MRWAFLLLDFQLQASAPYTWRTDSYEKWIKKETRLDIRTGSRA
jgi:hypothetical protein